LAAVSFGGEITSPSASYLLLLLPPVLGLEEGQHVFLMHILHLPPHEQAEGVRHWHGEAKRKERKLR
jgi:hypothetical protein